MTSAALVSLVGGETWRARCAKSAFGSAIEAPPAQSDAEQAGAPKSKSQAAGQLVRRLDSIHRGVASCFLRVGSAFPLASEEQAVEARKIIIAKYHVAWGETEQKGQQHQEGGVCGQSPACLQDLYTLHKAS